MAPILLESAKRLYRMFVSQGAEKIYAGQCCGKFYLGVAPAVKCRTCTKPPKNVEITSEKDLEAL